ncbi:MAG: Matrixin [Verrucomicrobiota bacterium]
MKLRLDLVLGALFLIVSCVASDNAGPTGMRFEEKDSLVLPVRVHLLANTNTTDIHTRLTDADVTRIFGKVNRVWSQAGIRFQVESVVRESAVMPLEQGPNEIPMLQTRHLLALRPAVSRATNLLHVYYVHRLPVNGIYFREAIFVKDTASLREVEGGIDEPIPRVTSHELGHALKLDHRQNRTNLMASGTTGIALNTDEIDRARRAAKELLLHLAADNFSGGLKANRSIPR